MGDLFQVRHSVEKKSRDFVFKLLLKFSEVILHLRPYFEF